MENVTPTLLNAIKARREALVEHARTIIENWYVRDDEGKLKNRFYAPYLRQIPPRKETHGESVWITWNKRIPMNGFKGKTVRVAKTERTKTIKVGLKHIKPNKSGPAYPLSLFGNAPEQELKDIAVAENRLGPIRVELAQLGRLRARVQDYEKIRIKEADETKMDADLGIPVELLAVYEEPRRDFDTA